MWDIVWRQFKILSSGWRNFFIESIFMRFKLGTCAFSTDNWKLIGPMCSCRAKPFPKSFKTTLQRESMALLRKLIRVIRHNFDFLSSNLSNLDVFVSDTWVPSSWYVLDWISFPQFLKTYEYKKSVKPGSAENPSKTVVKLSTYPLSSDYYSLLPKSLNFALAPRKSSP